MRSTPTRRRHTRAHAPRRLEAHAIFGDSVRSSRSRRTLVAARYRSRDEHPPVAGESARTPCHARDHVGTSFDIWTSLSPPRALPFARNPSLRARDTRATLRSSPAGNSQSASTAPNRRSKATRGSAPTTRSTSRPSRITTSSGIDYAPNLVASPGFASTSTITTLRCPACRSATSSSTGEIIRHGPHHAAQKSTTTATNAVVSATNVSLPASTTKGSTDLHRGDSRDSPGDRADAIACATGRAADRGHDHQTRTRRSHGRLPPPISRPNARGDASPPRREGHASSGRSRRRERRARRPAHGQGT
jgi:hypothetical protein